MKRNKVNIAPELNNLPIIDSNDKDLPEKRSNEGKNNPVLLNSLNIPEIEVMHMAKIKEFISSMELMKISQAYVIEQGDALKRVTIIQFPLKEEIVSIRHTEEIIDGLNYEEYNPETIHDLKLIKNYFNDTKKDRPSPKG